MSKRYKGATEWHGMSVYYEIVKGDWYGDNSIPGGTKEIDPYVDVLIIKAPGGEEVTEIFTEDSLDVLEIEILEGHND